MDKTFSNLLLPFPLLHSICYLAIDKRSAQVQLKCEFSCFVMPSPVLLVLWVYLDSVWQNHLDNIIYLHRGRGPFFQGIYHNYLLQIMCRNSDFTSMKHVHWICLEKVVLPSLIFLEGLQGERAIRNPRTTHMETQTAEKGWTCFSEFLCTMLPTWFSWNSNLRPPQGLCHCLLPEIRQTKSQHERREKLKRN